MMEKAMIFLIKLSNEYCGPNAFEGGVSDLVIVALSIVAVFISFYLCIRFFIRPGEKNPNHIKRKVLSDRYE